nr:transposase [Pontibacter mucosus]
MRPPQLLGLLALEERKPKVVVADKGYDSQLIRKALREQLIQAQIPERDLACGTQAQRKGQAAQSEQRAVRPKEHHRKTLWQAQGNAAVCLPVR